jgi:hypothetical protein
MISDKSYRLAQTFRVNQLGLDFGFRRFGGGPVAGLVGIEGGVVSGVINLESPSV